VNERSLVSKMRENNDDVNQGIFEKNLSTSSSNSGITIRSSRASNRLATKSVSMLRYLKADDLPFRPCLPKEERRKLSHYHMK
jgi:hypothetical protein